LRKIVPPFACAKLMCCCGQRRPAGRPMVRHPGLDLSQDVTLGRATQWRVPRVHGRVWCRPMSGCSELGPGP